MLKFEFVPDLTRPNGRGKEEKVMKEFDVFREVVAQPATAWADAHVVVRGPGAVELAPDGAWLDGVYVTDHPAYAGKVSEILGEEVLDLLEEIRNLLWSRTGREEVPA